MPWSHEWVLGGRTAPLEARSRSRLPRADPGRAHKGFRAGGNTVVEGNSELDPERLLGAEVGLDYRGARYFFGRVTGFWNRLEDLILQTTVATVGPAGGVVEPCGPVGPRGVCRQRNNVGEVRAAGVELEGEYRPSPRWSIALSAMLEDTEITSAPELPDLVGRTLPQAPDQRAVLRVRFSDPSMLDAVLQARYVAKRYEDDLNELELGGFTTLDLTLSRRLSAAASAYGGVENLFDRDYEISRNTAGLVAVGRRLAHLGVRLSYQ